MGGLRRGGRPAVGHNPPGGQAKEPGGDRPALVEIMTVHEDGDALRALNILQQRKDLPASDRIERGDRLVRQQQRGPAHERARDGDALLLPAGEIADRLVALVRQTDAREQPLGLRDLCARKQAQQRRRQRHVRQAGIEHVLPAGDRLYEGKVLIDRADALLHGALGAAARAGKRLPVDAHFPAVARQRAVEDAKQRRLPGAGRADDGHELPRLDAEGDVRQHLRPAAEALADVCSFQQHGFTFRRT